MVRPERISSPITRTAAVTVVDFAHRQVARPPAQQSEPAAAKRDASMNTGKVRQGRRTFPNPELVTCLRREAGHMCESFWNIGQGNAGGDVDDICAREREGWPPQRADPSAWAGRLRRDAQGRRADRGSARSDRSARQTGGHDREPRPVRLRIRARPRRLSGVPELPRLSQVDLHLDQPCRLPRHP